MNLRKASRVLAFLQGREHVLPEDVKALALDIFRHRILLDMRAEGDGLTTEDVIQQILDKVEIP
jgi:MoxR-like ATPase